MIQNGGVVLFKVSNRADGEVCAPPHLTEQRRRMATFGNGRA
jgi:hypothetical protein